jgi:mRNA interferase RelE/StbE
MIVKIDKSFEKDLRKLSDKSLNLKVAACIENVKKAETPAQIKNIKDLKGSAVHFRIRIGDFRIGLIIEKNEAIFIRILHRKEIYRYFP